MKRVEWTTIVVLLAFTLVASYALFGCQPKPHPYTPDPPGRYQG